MAKFTELGLSLTFDLQQDLELLEPGLLRHQGNGVDLDLPQSTRREAAIPLTSVPAAALGTGAVPGRLPRARRPPKARRRYEERYKPTGKRATIRFSEGVWEGGDLNGRLPRRVDVTCLPTELALRVARERTPFRVVPYITICALSHEKRAAKDDRSPRFSRRVRNFFTIDVTDGESLRLEVRSDVIPRLVAQLEARMRIIQRDGGESSARGKQLTAGIDPRDSVLLQRCHRIDARDPPRGQVARQERDRPEHGEHPDVGDRVGRTDAEQLRLQQPGGG